MQKYDMIVIGTGSAMNIVDPVLQQNPEMKVAIIDKDEPGGICLTRGCIPSKILLYPAELIRTIEKANDLNISIEIKKINFEKVMKRMRTLINKDIEMIQQSLSDSKLVDYYPALAVFTAPYTLQVGDKSITANIILLCTGSKPTIPPIKGLEKTRYLTSDTILKINQLPKSITIIGGGYIAAEYGHFLSAMGSKVTIIGRNPQFLPQEEPEIAALAKRELEKHLSIITNHEAREVKQATEGKKTIIAQNRTNNKLKEITADQILIAAGRGPNTDILHPEKAGIHVDERGWITVNEYLETSQPNIWAFGDANGKFSFKHAANFESLIVFQNAFMNRRVAMDYHAVPHAVFTYPEIASVGLREREAQETYGAENILIGFQRYQDTAKGEAMAVQDYFVKVLVTQDNFILGAHIIGPNASILIQEIVNLMYTPQQSATPLRNGMHIHPALTEVVERAFSNLMPPDQYHHLLEHHYKLHIDKVLMNTRSCQRCGQQVQAEAKYCHRCGGKIE